MSRNVHSLPTKLIQPFRIFDNVFRRIKRGRHLTLNNLYFDSRNALLINDDKSKFKCTENNVSGQSAAYRHNELKLVCT